MNVAIANSFLVVLGQSGLHAKNWIEDTEVENFTILELPKKFLKKSKKGNKRDYSVI